MAYFRDLGKGIKTTVNGMRLTLSHLLKARKSKISHDIRSKDYFKDAHGIVTLQYPHQTITVPEVGRYQLDLEMDDCIVCDKCAKVCPVDCIEIEPIKSSEVIRLTSDGSPVRLHAAKFDIDMAKCCFCGLCTTVCPTECLTMNTEYDYSVTDVHDLTFAFSNLSPEEAQVKRDLYEQFLAEKEAAKAAAAPQIPNKPSPSTGFKPSFKPNTPLNENSSQKKVDPLREDGQNKKDVNLESVEAKPAFVPKNRPAIPGINTVKSESKDEVKNDNTLAKPAFIPKSRPVIPGINTVKSESNEEVKNENTSAVPAFIPKNRPLIPGVNTGKTESNEEIKNENTPAKPTFFPKNRPVIPGVNSEKSEDMLANDTGGKPKFVPKLKPKS
jgi:formate hydrogenlyase subunit 6/NADH:ubiquinone oxidoreductase subunit I